MSVGLLLITHNRLGDELLNTATTTFAHCPLQADLVRVSDSCDPDAMVAEAHYKRAEVDSGGGVLVLTDIFGSTPSNIANRLLDTPDTIVVSGVSLPMLIRVMNYCTLALPDLARKAVSAGTEGIVVSGLKAPPAADAQGECESKPDAKTKTDIAPEPSHSPHSD